MVAVVRWTGRLISPLEELAQQVMGTMVDMAIQELFPTLAVAVAVGQPRLVPIKPLVSLLLAMGATALHPQLLAQALFMQEAAAGGNITIHLKDS